MNLRLVCEHGFANQDRKFAHGLILCCEWVWSKAVQALRYAVMVLRSLVNIIYCYVKAFLFAYGIVVSYPYSSMVYCMLSPIFENVVSWSVKSVIKPIEVSHRPMNDLICHFLSRMGVSLYSPKNFPTITGRRPTNFPGT